MKKVLALLLALTMVFALAACGGSGQTTTAAPAAPATTETKTETPAETKTEAPAAPAAEPVTLRLAHGLNTESIMGVAIQAWADKVAEVTEGRVILDVYGNGQLGSLQSVIEAVDIGEIDINMADASLMCETVPELNLLGLPMLIKDFEGWERLTQGEVGQKLGDIVAEKSNMCVLGWVFNGFREIIVKKDISSLDDLKGIILRSPEADIYIQTFKMMGFTPTPLNASEVYTALNSGVVEGADTSFEGFVTASYGEVCKQMIESNHMCASMTITANKNSWNKISDADKALMIDAYNEIMNQCSKDVYAASLGFKQQMIDDYGCACYTFTTEEQATLAERFEEYWSVNAAQNGYEDLLAEAVAIR